MRRVIQQLPQSLINRIAAGEVIERPASVVKELVENAIDAGARRIVVEIDDGGRELIRVIDNGSGLPVAELPLAFAPHATSKIVGDDDLFAIATMGFRGEALASIGAVSHARMLSRWHEADMAYEIVNRGGSISDPQAAAGNVGTTIEVRNLFYNVPARRKFLKGAATESGYISETVLRTALAHPAVAFKLLNNGRTALDLLATEPTRRWLSAWPQEFHEQRLPLETRDAEIELTGMIGLPELARPTTKYQHVYLNGRPIRDKFVQHALREAYRGLTEPGRHPAAVLLLTLPPGDVDVNVHPTKSEVRFKDSGRIHSLVMSGVRETLLGGNLSPRAMPRVNEPPATERAALQAQLAAFFRGGPPEQTTAASVPWQLATPVEQPALLTESPDAENRSASAAYAVEPVIATPIHSALQLHNSYLVAESDDGLIIIDQHALHERILFEDLKARITRGPLESQQMLVPQTFTASSSQLALLEQIGPLLARLGVEARVIGPNAVAVYSFPSFLDKLDPADFVGELLERGEQQKLDLHEEELLHDVLDMMACKAAVKAGDPLTPAEITALLQRRELVDRASNCPHGRPTTLRLSLKDLEKQFKRTGF